MHPKRVYYNGIDKKPIAHLLTQFSVIQVRVTYCECDRPKHAVSISMDNDGVIPVAYLGRINFGIAGIRILFVVLYGRATTGL